jgi:pyruvate dehydrogenase E2 component (dihydrolipoamide acetyltransferase)
MSNKENVQEIVMPKLGLIMTEAMLVEWHKENQDWVEQGELLFSLESEKTIIDIEAPTSGYVQILVQAGEVVPVLTPVALISPEPGEIEGYAPVEVEARTSQGRKTGDVPDRTVRDLASEADPNLQKTSPASHLDGMRGIIAERLTDSWQQRPQVTLNSQMDASVLVADRERRKAAGNIISYNTYLMKASALALEEFPQLNVYLTPDSFIQRDEINIGLAVDTERGLMVPVLKDVPTRSILELNQELLDLVERTKEGRLLPDEYSGGSFSVTNLGAFGVDSFAPLINPPESASLGVGRIVDQPVIQDGELQGRKALTLSLSFDHRIIDGAPAAKFLACIVDILQDPTQLKKL